MYPCGWFNETLAVPCGWDVFVKDDVEQYVAEVGVCTHQQLNLAYKYF